MKILENPQYSYRRIIVAGVAGNLMERYDFAIYGYMVPVISRLFFLPKTCLIPQLQHSAHL